MITGKPFDPATETSRRPTPEKFAHLREWVEKVVKNIELTSISDITNINQQLEQIGKLYIDNVISRVIAQLIGKYGDGFVTLEATADGKLKVEAALEALTTVGLEAGSNLIGEVNVVGREHEVLQAAISFAAAANNCIVSPVTGKKIKIVNIMFTVAGEVNLTLRSGTTARSGALDFGGTDEPRGMVHHLGDFPLETASGEGFCILASTAVQVSGYVTYYAE
jgi:hypothetical protein